MMISAYFLSRCGEQVADGHSKPPRVLGVKSWKEAYDLFFDALGDGRTPAQFRNSMKNARDTFDTLFENGRIGWVDKDGKQPSLSKRFVQVHEDWKNRLTELEAYGLRFQTASLSGEGHEVRSPEARSEGGEELFVSVRRERDPRLREDAVAIHGFNCMACGFNFGEFYGEIGKKFIEVHHVVPLSEAGRTKTNPETDLIVLCANCHRIIHRRISICLTLKELKRHISNARK